MSAPFDEVIHCDLRVGGDPRITDEVVAVAGVAWNKAYWSERTPSRHEWMRAALEAAVPLLAPQPVVDRETLLALLCEHQAFEIAFTTDGGIAGARKKLADAVLALLNGSAS